MRKASGQQGAAGKVKMRGCEKKLKRTGAEAKKCLVITYDNSSIKTMCTGSINSRNAHPPLGAFARHLSFCFGKAANARTVGPSVHTKTPRWGLKIGCK